MPTMTGGQALVQQLKLEGVEMIFGLPGVQLDYIFDALYEERSAIRVIHTRHEQATAYMADGYARSTGRVGTCLVVPGPGLLNASAALATAYACSSPVLCVTGQIESRLIGLGRGALHEVKDQMTAIASVTKWQGRALSPQEVPGLVHRAFRELLSGRPRPVEIEVPPDVLQASAEVRLFEPEMPAPRQPDSDKVDAAVALLAAAQRPLILAGGGVIRSAAWEELQRVAETLEAPVVMTNNGRGALSDRHHLAFSERALRELAPDADVILAVGTRLIAGVNPPWRRDTAKVIQLDIDPEEIGRNYPPDVPIEADARAGLAALSAALGKRSPPSRREELLALKERLAAAAAQVQPQASLAMAIRDALPDDAIVFTESTQVGYWCNQNFPVYAPRTYFGSGYQGTLGYGFATALGAQAGNPDRQVVSINGDGGFMYNVQELSTMAQQQLPLIAIIFNDRSYGNVRRIQQERFGGREIAVDLHNPDFLALAAAFGVKGRRAEGAEALGRELRAALAASEPCLIEVPVGQMEWFMGRQQIRQQA